MQQAISKGRWAVIAVFLTVLALAFSMVAVQPAVADDDLAAGGTSLKAQSGETTTWPFAVYLQYGDKTPTLVKSYTKEKFTNLAPSSPGLIAGLSWDGSAWHVTTAVNYVVLDELLADAGINWDSGATIKYENTASSESGSMTFDDVEKLFFYPETKRTVKSTESAERHSFVFGLENEMNAIIGDKGTAEEIRNGAKARAQSDDSILAVMGSLESDYNKMSGTTVSADRFVKGINKITITFSSETKVMYRLYNPNSGEHFYTANAAERDMLKDLGWNYEGEAWTAPVVSNTPVYRVYNPNAGDHHYTTSKFERDHLVSVGWIDEGIGWYSDDSKTVELFRLYNPNAVAGAHHYTKNAAERDYLASIGWNKEGTGWYGVA